MSQTKRDRTQKEIMAAAQNIIRMEGHEKITVRHLAEVTGYSHTVFYHYFKSLDGLLWSLRLEMIEEMIDAMREDPKRSGNPIDDLISVFSDYAGYFMKNPNVFRFFYFYPFSRPQGEPESDGLESRFQGMWLETFSGLTESGILPEHMVFVVAKTLIYAISGMLLLNLSSGGMTSPIDIQREIRQIIGFLIEERVSDNAK